MIWKVIGQSVIGSSHVQSQKDCEDALHYENIQLGDRDCIICFVSDGAGSAKYAGIASETSVQVAVKLALDLVKNDVLTDSSLIQIAERVYDKLNELAESAKEPKNEFSCTLLGFILLPELSAFIQIGDGAIVRNDGSGFYTHIFWPHNGEYQNTTAFLIDNPNLPNLKVKIINEPISEIAIFTDGLQMLTLNNETETVHQPFFNNLFKWLRQANEIEHISILNNKLIEYLSSDIITNRTDDDKTLLLATKLKNA